MSSLKSTVPIHCNSGNCTAPIHQLIRRAHSICLFVCSSMCACMSKLEQLELKLTELRKYLRALYLHVCARLRAHGCSSAFVCA